jgi:site-specific DNA recombinase
LIKKTKASSGPKRAAIYCRVSTYEQGKGDFSSLDSQEKILREHCANRGWPVTDVYVDTKTGATLEREELVRLLADATVAKFDVVVITKLDRISRSVKDFLELDEKLRNIDVDIVVATQQIDTTTPGGKLQRTMMLAFAEFERDIIGERTREKLYSQAQKGLFGGGLVNLGYDLAEKKLTVNPNEAELVRRIFEYYLEEPSTAKVAEKLNKEGYRAKKRTYKNGKVGGGGPFNKESIKGILRNKVFIGLVTFKGETFKGLHEPIIDEGLFNKVQARLDESITSRMDTHQSITPWTLHGILKCGLCGKALTPSWTSKQGKKYYYFKCGTATRHDKSYCPSKDLKCEDLELFTRKLIIQLCTDKEFFNAAFTQMANNSSKDVENDERDLRESQINLGVVSRDLQSLTSQLLRLPDLKNSETVASKIKELELNKRQLTENINKARQKIDRLKQQKLGKAELKTILSNFDSVYDTLSIEDKRRFNKALFTEISSTVRKDTKTGEISFKIRVDGVIRAIWEDIVNQVIPGSQLRKERLPGPDSNQRPSG